MTVRLVKELKPLVNRLWMLDSSYGTTGLNEKDTEERDQLIETICYKVSNELIDDEPIGEELETTTYQQLLDRNWRKD